MKVIQVLMLSVFAIFVFDATCVKMRKFLQNKLWRDNAVARVEEMGGVVHWQRLDDAAYDKQLRAKLVEEAQEVVSAPTRTELVEELADMCDIAEALAQVHGISKEEIVAAQEKKRAMRGGFAERIFVTMTEYPEGSYWEQYCLAQPSKYQEIIE